MNEVDFSHTHLFWSYTTHSDFCRKLEESAKNKPVPSPDPILRFTHANSTGSSIDARDCYAIADRISELTADWPQLEWLTTGADKLCRGLRAAARSQEPFRLS